MSSVEFCYICFDCNKTLRDIQLDEDENRTILKKMKTCVNEIDWSLHKKLLICSKCVKELNRAHDFKKKCLQSSETLKLYLLEIERANPTNVADEKQERPVNRMIRTVERGDDKKIEEATVVKYLNLLQNSESVTESKTIVTTNHGNTNNNQVIQKIILTNPNNFFVNLVPTTLLTRAPGEPKLILPKIIMGQQLPSSLPLPTPLPPPTTIATTTTQFIPVKENQQQHHQQHTVSIDPSDFNTENKTQPLPPLNVDHYSDEKTEFFNSGHFLLQDIERSQFYCDKCLLMFDSIKSLNVHVRLVHPFKCEECKSEFSTKAEFDDHIPSHRVPQVYVKEVFSLGASLSSKLAALKKLTPNTDFLKSLNTTSKPQVSEVKVNDATTTTTTTAAAATAMQQSNHEQKKYEILEAPVKCQRCEKEFSDFVTLLDHQNKMHRKMSPQRRKYFVKGMKNAQCDICQRLFSTYSYMQQHRKLHDRKSEWKRKIYDFRAAFEKDYKYERELSRGSIQERRESRDSMQSMLDGDSLVDSMSDEEEEDDGNLDDGDDDSTNVSACDSSMDTTSLTKILENTQNQNEEEIDIDSEIERTENTYLHEDVMESTNGPD